MGGGGDKSCLLEGLILLSRRPRRTKTPDFISYNPGPVGGGLYSVAEREELLPPRERSTRVDTIQEFAATHPHFSIFSKWLRSGDCAAYNETTSQKERHERVGVTKTSHGGRCAVALPPYI